MRLGGEASTELGAPLADRLVADDDASLGEQILRVAEAEVEPKVQPDSVSDDLRWEAVPSIRRVVGTGWERRTSGDAYRPSAPNLTTPD